MCIEYAPDVMSKSISAPFGDYSKGGWQIVLFFEAPRLLEIQQHAGIHMTSL